MVNSQRACSAVETPPFYEAEAYKRQVASGRFAGKDSEGNPILQVVEKIPQPENDNQGTRSRDYAAEKACVNSHYVSDAKQLKKERPDLYAQVHSGRVGAFKQKLTVSESICRSYP